MMMRMREGKSRKHSPRSQRRLTDLFFFLTLLLKLLKKYQVFLLKKVHAFRRAHLQGILSVEHNSVQKQYICVESNFELFIAESSSNTVKLEWNIRGVSHREGGWPKEIDCKVTFRI